MGHAEVATTSQRWDKRRAFLLIFLAAMVGLNGFFAWRVKDLMRQGYPDFTSLYCAGKTVRLGLADHLYDDRAQAEVQQTFVAEGRIRTGLLPYMRPPFEALLFAPMTKLSYSTAFLLWDALNLLVLIGLPFLLRPYVELLQRTSPLWCLLGSLAFFPVAVALVEGQDTILLLLLFACAYVAMKRKEDLIAGCWLGLGMFRFHLILPVVLVLVLRKQYRAVYGWILVTVALVLTSIGMVGWHGALGYPEYLWRVETALYGKTLLPGAMPTLRGLIDTLLSAHFPKTITHGLTAVLSAVLVYSVATAGKAEDGEASTDLRFSLYVLLAILVSYHSFVYDMPLLLLAVVLSVNHAAQSPMNGKWSRILWYGPILLMFLGPLQMLLALQYKRVSLLAVVLLFWFWNVRREMRRLSSAPARQLRP